MFYIKIDIDKYDKYFILKNVKTIQGFDMLQLDFKNYKKQLDFQTEFVNDMYESNLSKHDFVFKFIMRHPFVLSEKVATFFNNINGIFYKSNINE